MTAPPSAATSALQGTRFAGQLVHLPRVESTNALALEAAAAGARTGVWLADEQTAGRGRGGHTWHSSPGDGLYLSVLVAPALPLRIALRLSLATGLAAQRAIRDVTGFAPDLRWPNDLLLGGRKCGGILVETATEPAQPAQEPTLRYAVIGVGINLNHAAFPAELAAIATSLRLACGHVVSRDALVASLLHALDDELTQIEREGGRPQTVAPEQALLARFTRASTWVRGKRVRVDDGYTGTTAGLSAEGFLRVEADDGTARTVLSGGVRELTARS